MNQRRDHYSELFLESLDSERHLITICAAPGGDVFIELVQLDKHTGEEHYIETLSASAFGARRLGRLLGDAARVASSQPPAGGGGVA